MAPSNLGFVNPRNKDLNKDRKKVVIKRSTKPTNYKQEYKDQYNKDSAPSVPVGSAVPAIATRALPSTQHIKISVRLPRGIVTSLTLKKNIIALWMLYRTPLESDPEQVCDLIEEGKDVKEDSIKEMATRFVYRSLEDWDYDTGKGLSEFVTERMIEDALEIEDHAIYQIIMANTKA
jgi:hypothetical protein